MTHCRVAHEERPYKTRSRFDVGVRNAGLMAGQRGVTPDSGGEAL